MFATFALTALLASTSVLVAHADVTPSVPGPGVVYKEGQPCQIVWTGDAVSKTVWKNMAIELMTGDNFNMIHLTTVANGLDGTVDGTFNHTCPPVIPNSAIYFYQFSAPGTTVKTWTTRFTIASPSGATTPPTNANQPTTNAAIPWGTGALKDPSTAVPPPGTSNVASVPASNGASSSTSPVIPPVDTNTVAGSTSPVLTPTSTSTSSRFTTSISASATPSTTPKANSTTGSTKDNGAVGFGVNNYVLQAVVTLGASAMVMAVLL